MPVITVNLKDFARLAGEDLSMDLLRTSLPMLGTAWERETEEEFDVEVFPNRPDMFSTEGLARAFKGFLGASVGVPEYSVHDSVYEAVVDPKLETIRPYLVLAAITDVKMGEEALKSLMQLQEKLHVSYCRYRRKASIGVYDLDALTFPLTYTTMESNFRFVPLEFQAELTLAEILEKHPKGVDYGHLVAGLRRYPILMDEQGKVLSMPPIVNSAETRVTEKTRNLLVDVTGFEWGTVNMVLNIVVSALAERGGDIRRVETAYPYNTPSGKRVMTPNLALRKLELSPGYARKLLGLDLSVEEMMRYMGMMRLSVEKVEHDAIIVLVPPYRADIMHPVDFVEDIAIAYGYNNITPEIPAISTIGGENSLEIFGAKVRDLMVGLGYQEVMTYVLTNPRMLFGMMRILKNEAAEIGNPKTSEYTVCRSWLLPSLMQVLSRNRHIEYPQRIFEAEDVIQLDARRETGARTVKKLAAASAHSEASFSEAKAAADSLLKVLGVEAAVKPGSHPSFLEGRFGFITVNGRQIGFLGEIHPEVVVNFGLENPTSAFEIDLEEILKRLCA